MAKKATKQSEPKHPEKSAPAVSIEPRPAKVDQGLSVDAAVVSQIDLDGCNDRLRDDPAAIAELAASMEARGLLEPIVLGKIKGDGLHLVAGHRRLAAAKLLKWETIRATVRNYESDDELQLDRATENIHRLELNPVEEAYAVAAMIDVALPAAHDAIANLALNAVAAADADDVRWQSRFRAKAIEIVAGKLGKSVTWVTDRAYLSRLDGPARQLVLDGRLPITYAREICKVADPKRRSELAEEFAADKALGSQPGDFRDLRNAVAENLMSLSQVPWKLNVAFAGAPACEACPKNSANQPKLFEHVPPSCKGNQYGINTFKEPAAGVCTDSVCYGEKNTQANRALAGKGGSIARRINALPKDQRQVAAAGVTAKAVADLGVQLKVDVPRFLDTGDLASRVKTEMAKKPATGSKPSSNSSSSHQPAKKSAAQEAREKAEKAWTDKLRVRQEKVEKAIIAMIAKDPLKRAVLGMLQDATLWNDLEHREWGPTSVRVRAIAAAAKPGMQQLINLLASPTLDGFRIAGEFLKADSLNRYNPIDPHTDVVDRIAKALGIITPPRPVLEVPAAAPKPKPEKADGPAARAKASKKKPSSKPDADDLDDEES